MSGVFQEMLIGRAARMGIALSREQAEAFHGYYRLLMEANARFNLTRVPEDEAEFIDRNLLDSLTPLTGRWPEEARTLIDVGTGAGFPGLPIAIARPDIRVTLLDALDKRVQFLKNVVEAIGLDVNVIHGRAEDYARGDAHREHYDVACARAVASVNVLSEYLLPFVRIGGTMLALKGPGVEEELTTAATALQTLGGGEALVDMARIPDRDWRHCLLWVAKARSTPEKYPRRAGMPEKRPL